jgi:hypothetical protein
MEEIKIWLESKEKDFDQGYKLLAQTLKNQSILHYLQRKRDKAKLEYELSKLVPFIVVAPTEAEVNELQAINAEVSKAYEVIKKQDAKLKIVQSGQINYDLLPEALKPIYDNTISKYKEMRSVHEKMKLATSDKQRAELRKTLDELDNEIESGWVVINAWSKSGVLPTSTGSDAGSKNTDYKAVNAARTYVSRAIEKAETTSGKKLEKLVADLQTRVDTLIAAEAALQPETWEKLLALGIKDPENDKKTEAPVAE